MRGAAYKRRQISCVRWNSSLRSLFEGVMVQWGRCLLHLQQPPFLLLFCPGRRVGPTRILSDCLSMLSRCCFLDLSTCSVIALKRMMMLMTETTMKCQVLPKHLLHVEVLLGRGLKELDAHLIGKLSGVLGQHHLSVGIVIFVANQHSVHHFAVLFNFMEPSGIAIYKELLKAWLVVVARLPFDIGKGLAGGDIVDHNDPVGASVIGRGDGSEPLLTSSVPDL